MTIRQPQTKRIEVTVVGLDVVTDLLKSILKQGAKIMGQTEDLREAVGQLGVDLGEAIARVEAKVSELGEPDPDLSADIQSIKDVSTGLDALLAEPPPA